MKRLILLLVTLAVILFMFMLYRANQQAYKVLPESQPAPFEGTRYAGWISYQSPSDLFNVSFPTAPQFTTDVKRDNMGVAERTNEIYVSEQESGTIYLISVVRYHAKEDSLPLAPEQMMSNVMYEMIDNQKDNQLIGFKKNTILGNNGLEFHIANHQIQMDSQVFTKLNDLYILSYIANIKDYNEKDFAYFVNSFKLKSAE